MPNKSHLVDEGSANDAAQFIAQALKETDAKPVAQITAVVEVIGSEPALALLAEVERIETSGGMLLPDGNRRRTPGGVFFYLARKRLPKADSKRIFPPPKHTPKRTSATGSAAAVPESSRLKPRPRIVDLEAMKPNARTQTWGGGARRPPTQEREGRRPWQQPARAYDPGPVQRAAPQRNWSDPATDSMPQWRPGPAAPAPKPPPAVRPDLAEPLTKKDFVLAQPASMPATEVVAAAKQRGLSLSTSYVYALRQKHPQPASEVFEGGSGTETLSQARAQLFSILAAADPDETATINDVLRAVQADLAALAPRKRRQILAALLLEELLAGD